MKTALRRWLAALVAAPVLISAAACTRADSGASTATDQGPASELRLGYFPNVTHASALIGVDKGFFSTELGSTKLTTQAFNAGPKEVSALLGGSLDAAFIGSGPAINAFDKSKGSDVRVVAGATSGGAQLVVAPGITSPQQLAGKTIATPQEGNTQDVAFKKWLSSKDIKLGTEPGDVRVQYSDNPQTFDAFRAGTVQGGWLPEPWASRLVLDAGATVLVDEKNEWPAGAFPSTVLLVRTEFLHQHPATVTALLRGELATTDWATANPGQAKTVVNAALAKLTGKGLSQPVLDRAFADIALTVDPMAAQFPQLAKDQVTARVTKTVPNLHGMAELTLLNKVLAARGKPTVNASGLDGQ